MRAILSLVLLSPLWGILALGSTFGISELRDLITRQNITTIEALLPQLPKDLRLNYTLMHSSKSIQGASAQNPRAILFGQDAQLVLAFNGSSKQSGFNHLEVMDFDEASKSFNFYDVTFSKNPKETPSQPIFSKANPPLCLRCHQSPPQPIWEPYNTWVGAYGGMDDHLLITYKGIPPEIQKFDSLRNFLELKSYAAFLTHAKGHPRYGHLIRRSDRPSAPYYTNAQYERNLINMPNLRLTELLTRRQAQAVFERLKNSELYRKYKFALAYSYLNCGEIGALRNAVYQDLRSKSKPLTGSLLPGFAELLGVDFEKSSRNLWLGFNNYDLSKGHDYSEYFDGYNSAVRYLANLLFKDLITDLPALAQYHQEYRLDNLPKDYYWKDHVQTANRLGASLVAKAARKGCSLLAERLIKSLRETANKPPATALMPSKKTEAPLFNQCIECHAGSSDSIRALPFADLPELTRLLTQDKALYQKITFSLSPHAGKARMPKGATLTEQESQAIQNYLDEIKALQQ